MTLSIFLQLYALLGIVAGCITGVAACNRYYRNNIGIACGVGAALLWPLLVFPLFWYIGTGFKDLYRQHFPAPKVTVPKAQARRAT